MQLIFNSSTHDLRIAHTDRIGLGAQFFDTSWLGLLKRFGPVRNLLEMGSGAGMTGLTLLKSNLCQHLVLSDIDEECVYYSKLNSIENGLAEKVTVRQSDCWDNLIDLPQFDLVIFNMPGARELNFEIPKNANRLRWLDEGWQTHGKLYRGALAHLRPGGRLITIDRVPTHEQIKDPNHWCQLIRESGLNFEELFFIRPTGLYSFKKSYPDIEFATGLSDSNRGFFIFRSPM